LLLSSSAVPVPSHIGHHPERIFVHLAFFSDAKVIISPGESPVQVRSGRRQGGEGFKEEFEEG